MEPDIIIQQKEWSELTGEEREVLREIAADEQEFNLLKKMLLIAAADEVPKVGENVRENVNARLTQRGKVRSIRPWYYATAAMLVLAVITWIVVQRKPELPPEALINIPKSDTTNIKVAPTLPAATGTLGTKLVVKAKPVKPTIKRKMSPGPQPAESSLAVNATIRQNTDLLTLVTAVY
jgi:hypothetical protein